MFRGLVALQRGSPSSISVSVSPSGIPAVSHVCLNCRLIVSESQYFCGLAEVTGRRKRSLAVLCMLCEVPSMFTHVLCLRCGEVRVKVCQGWKLMSGLSQFSSLYSFWKTMRVQLCYCWSQLTTRHQGYKKKKFFFFFFCSKKVFFGLSWVVNVKCVSPGLVQPCRGSPPTTEFLDPLRPPPPFFLNAWIEFVLSCYHRATNHSSPLTCKSSAYTSCLYSGDFQNFLCFTESQRSNPPTPQKNKNAVLSYQIWYHLPEVRTMTQTIIAYSTEYIMLLIVTETFVINIRGASAAQVSRILSVIPVTRSFPEA